MVKNTAPTPTFDVQDTVADLHNENENVFEEFNPTDQWQDVMPGHSIPPGCETKMNIKTGRVRARFDEDYAKPECLRKEYHKHIFKCNLCGNTFLKKAYLDAHVNAIHIDSQSVNVPNKPQSPVKPPPPASPSKPQIHNKGITTTPKTI